MSIEFGRCNGSRGQKEAR
ncbi:Protein of unknown function [Propionibacterium freudenreichii]|nr:Protein of unknown function [Propionibacterium freudenreichii subsp. freudenreichii]CEG87497.1 Protein of unknown function [Propionibacterium freudenreichii]CEG90967.1 Protein of unknown function [Propionibacterium freudenreichii]CEG93564.1 Protein of unknown function [Propionibacterium freudenreichii]CEH01315.1 Protein of unknown function [Propionibacterium freudenreichii]